MTLTVDANANLKTSQILGRIYFVSIMNFSFGPPKTDANVPTAGAGAVAGTAAGGFAFGTAASNPSIVGAGDAKTGTAKSFSFGTTTPAAAAPAPSFNMSGFGTPTTASGFALGATPQAVALGSIASSTPAQPSAFNLHSVQSLASVPATNPSTGFGLAAPAAPVATPTTGFSLGGLTSTPAAALNLSAAAMPASSTGFGLLGTPKTSAAAAPTLAFNLGTPSTLATSLATSAAFSLGGTSTATAVTTTSSFLSIPASSTTATSLSMSLAPPATTTALPTTGNLTFGQLVDGINKWTIDLEEQGKLFSNQAKQLNAWDRLLVSNGEKVLSLNSGIERVKQQQQQLDQELDFVLAQQKELEDLITPLEKELNDIPLTDVDRLHTYQLSENMDTQLKQMSEDLKEIIEQLNESNKNQENSNPITQIRKILNAHMDSLQWIDRQTSKITGHLDQISKMNDLHRKSHEHSLKKTYD